LIFVDSMSDLFHEDIPFAFIERVFDVMQESKQHVFQILTKRSKRLRELAPDLPWAENIWIGVTLEKNDYLYRLDDLKTIPARIRFLSMEPLLEQIDAIDLDDIEWVIVGGESGPGARAIKPSWVRNIRDACLKTRTPFFFKQWGGFNKKKNGRLLDNAIWSQMPQISNEFAKRNEKIAV